jgi:hypothetical protein
MAFEKRRNKSRGPCKRIQRTGPHPNGLLIYGRNDIAQKWKKQSSVNGVSWRDGCSGSQ